MKKVLVDTSAWVAIFDKRDENHKKAKSVLEYLKNNRIRLVISDYIFDETITTVLSNAGHRTARQVGEFLFKSKIIDFVWLDLDLKLKAWELFKKYDDKEFSFTDCTSFVLSKQLKVNEVFAFDDDFKTMGLLNVRIPF
jgi:hypothetical protein